MKSAKAKTLQKWVCKKQKSSSQLYKVIPLFLQLIIEVEFKCGGTKSWFEVGTMHCSCARGALGEGAMHRQVAAHRASCHCAFLNWCGAYTRHGALGVRAVHKASKQSFVTTSSKTKTTPLLLLQVSLQALAIDLDRKSVV